jgi:replicative DNA helicase
MSERLPPQDLDAEMALLGSMMVDDAVVDDIVPIVATRDAFYTEPHQRIYDALVAVHESDSPMDLFTVKAELEARGDLERVGGLEYVADLSGSFADWANAKYYAELVLEKYRRRQLIGLCDRMGARAYDVLQDLDETTGKVAAGLDAIVEPTGQAQRTDGVDRLEQLRADLAEPSRQFIETGIMPIDNGIGGLPRGALTVVAARPSVGKSALLLTCGLNAATATDAVPTLLVSVEMNATEVTTRAVGVLTGANVNHMRTGRADHNVAIDQAQGQLSRGHWFVCDGISNLREICAVVRSHVRKHGVKLVLIDYLQLCRPAERAENQNLAVAAMSRAFKLLANETGAAVVVASQLNREATKGAQLHHLRDSGAIEQDADVVVFLERETEPSLAEVSEVMVNIAKNRNGPCPGFKLAMHLPTTRFTGLAVIEERDAG